MSVSLEILEILIKSEFPPSSYFNFAGLTRSELRRLSLDDLESQLRSRIPQSSTQSSLIARFICNLFSHQEGQIPEQPSIPIPEVKRVESVTTQASPPPLDDDKDIQSNGNHAVQQTYENGRVFQRQRQDSQSTEEQECNSVKKEQVDQNATVCSTKCSSSPISQTSLVESEEANSDSDVEIVDEVINVSIIRELDAETKVKERILQSPVIIDDDDEITPAEQNKSSTSQKRKIETKPTALMSATPTKPGKVMKKSSFQLGRSAIECPTGIGPSRYKRAEWAIREFHDLISPFQSPNVEELSIVSNCDESTTSASEVSALYDDVSLPNLTALKIRNCVNELRDESGDVNYSTQLNIILAGSPVLSRIEICYEKETALKTLLRVLGSVQTLPSLSSLIIRHQVELVNLVASDLIALGQIAAPNLKELHLACCIMAEGDGTEIKDAFQLMLQRFTNLRKLKIDGCFVAFASATDSWPKIVLNFPKLIHLQNLELGTRCVNGFCSTLETVEEPPKKKTRKKLTFNLDPGHVSTGHKAHASDDFIEEKSEEYFPVSINFPGVMPRLVSISLGVLYEFQTLYFPELPVLESFIVPSGWAQSYPDYFPPQIGKKSSREGLSQLSNVKILKLPDTFQDCFTIRKILPHFPHLAHICITLPTVKFLRTFAKTMSTTGPASFEYLEMRTQFDFASSLDSCVLDEIAKPSPEEMQKIKILKNYPHWEEYVKENSIELPQTEGEEEDPDKFCGLGVLFKKLKWITIVHMPRTLRLPKGPRHWIDHPKPEFTNTIIGFKEYPFSKEVEAACPKTMVITLDDFDMSQVADDFRIKRLLKPTGSGPAVLLDPAAQSIKKEMKREKGSAAK